MEVLELTMDNYSKEVQESDKPVVIDFYADWCGPCKMMGPVFHELAGEMTDVKFVKCNVDNNQDIAMKFQVQSIPTLIVIKGDKEAARSVGFVQKDDLRSKIQGAVK